MSDIVRRALRQGEFEPDLEPFGVPKGFGVGVNMRDKDAVSRVRDASFAKGAELKQYEKAFNRGGTEERAEILKTLSEQIGRYVTETDPNKPGADGAVVAEMASALGQLDPDFRNSVLRAAGNPEIFRPLQDVSLPDIPKGELGDESNKVLQQAEGISRTVKPEEQFETNDFMAVANRGTADQAPMMGRPSSVMVDPAYYRRDRKTGDLLLDEEGMPIVVPQSKTYKNYRDRPDNPNSMMAAQKKEIKAIEGEFGKGNTILPPINKEEPSGFRVSRDLLDDDSYDPILQEYVDDGTVEEIAKRPPPKNNVLTIGTAGDATGQRSTGVSPDRSARYAGRNSPPLDRVIENQNTSGVNERTLREMYRLTVEEPAAGIIDLDAMFPQWRGRYQQRVMGQIEYPSRAPSADFVVTLMEGILTPNDPNFRDDMRDLVQRSIDAAPAKAPRNPNWKPGDRRDARWYDEHVFIAGEGWAEKLDRGPDPDDPDYPASLYDRRSAPKQLERETITDAPVSEVDFDTIEQPRGIEGPETELLNDDELMALLEPDENPAPNTGDGGYDEMSADELMSLLESPEDAPEEPANTDALFDDFNKQFPDYGDSASIYKKTPLSPLRNLVA